MFPCRGMFNSSRPAGPARSASGHVSLSAAWRLPNVHTDFTRQRAGTVATWCLDSMQRWPKAMMQEDQELEAAPGFEPGNKGFADPRLTTWLCRLEEFVGRRLIPHAR